MNDSDYNIIADELTEDEMELLHGLSTQREYKDREIIFNKKSIADSMFIIAKGHVSILMEDTDEIESIVDLHEGEFLGEMALLGDSRRNATARADGSVVLWEIGREMFSSLLENDKLLADKLMKSNRERGGSKGSLN